jgi:uncharacterized protein YqgC (DUF456 family)
LFGAPGNFPEEEVFFGGVLVYAVTNVQRSGTMRRCVMALALLAALLLSGCAAQYTNSEFVGSWQAVKGAMGGVAAC